MAQANPFADMQKMFSEFKAPSLDYSKMFEASQAQMERISAANQALAENAQAITKRQAEIARENVERMLEVSRDIMSSGSPELGLSKQADAAKQMMEASLSNARELSEMCSKSGMEVMDMMNRQITDSVNSMSKMAA